MEQIVSIFKEYANIKSFAIKKPAKNNNGKNRKLSWTDNTKSVSLDRI
jgi:hypothetical protein